MFIGLYYQSTVLGNVQMKSDDIKNKNDILEVANRLTTMSKSKDNEYVGTCPFHNEKTPSFKVNVSTERFHCFGCGKDGTVVDLLAHEAGISVTELLSKSEDCIVDNLANKCFEANSLVSKKYHGELLTNDSYISRLIERGISLDAIAEYEIGCAGEAWNMAENTCRANGYDESVLTASGLCLERKNGKGIYDAMRERITFPITRPDGKIRGFSGRTTVGDKRKYVNSPNCKVYNKSKHLFGISQAIKQIRASRECVVTEGAMDCCAIWSSGVHNVVATLGSSFTADHAKYVAGIAETVYLAFDGDEAGHRATSNAIKELCRFPVEIRCVAFEDGKDASEVCSCGNGFQQYLDESVLWYKWIIDNFEKTDSPIKRAKLATHLKEYLNNINDNIIRNEIAIEIEVISGLNRKYFAKEEKPSGIGVSVVNDDDNLGNDEDGKYNESLKMPESVINPGGLISEGMAALSVPGIPNIWQYKLPVVLSVIGRAITGKIRHPQAIPNFYNVIIGPSGSGKSSACLEMANGLKRAGIGDILGPSRFASEQAVYSSLQNEGSNLLCFLDEVSSMLAAQGNKSSQNASQVKALLELYSQSGSTSGEYKVNYANKERNIVIDGLLSFSFCGCATPRCLASLNTETLEDGLFSRINVWYREGKVEARGEKLPENKKLDDFCLKLYYVLRSGNSQTDDGVMIDTSKVRNQVREIDQWCANQINLDPLNDARNSFITKVYLDSIRLAMVHMASSRDLWCIADPMEEQDIEYGYQVAKALALWKTDVLLTKVHSGDFETDWRDFVAGIKAAAPRARDGMVSRKAIADRRKRANNWTPRRWEEIIDFLVSTGRITVSESGRCQLYGLV